MIPVAAISFVVQGQLLGQCHVDTIMCNAVFSLSCLNYHA